MAVPRFTIGWAICLYLTRSVASVKHTTPEQFVITDGDGAPSTIANIVCRRIFMSFREIVLIASINI